MIAHRSADQVRRCGRQCAGAMIAAAALAAGVLAAGCSGPQSALDPAGRGSRDIAELFWWMTAGGAVVWVAVVALGAWAWFRDPDHQERRARVLVIGGGALVPTVVLGVLLTHGLALMPPLLAPAPEGSLRIVVSGEQWWWRVRYERVGEPAVELANEIRLPVDEPVNFEFESPDVIHAFWIPALGGKMDMIPGRRTRLKLHPERVGVFRGVCAEYCGTSHARMAFDVVVLPGPEFERWLAGQRADAAEPVDGAARRGRDLFQAHGCGACHAVRGTNAQGRVGPDLTHVGSRRTLGAGTLMNDASGLRRWLVQTDVVKPDVLMPHYRMLPDADLDALVAYLQSLP